MTDIIAYALILLHTVDGFEVAVNPAHITSLHPTSEVSPGRGNQSNSIIVKGVRCVVGLSSGKFYSVVEDCPTVKKMMEAVP